MVFLTDIVHVHVYTQYSMLSECQLMDIFSFNTNTACYRNFNSWTYFLFNTRNTVYYLTTEVCISVGSFCNMHHFGLTRCVLL